jgi:hypothetical protein
MPWKLPSPLVGIALQPDPNRWGTVEFRIGDAACAMAPFTGVGEPVPPWSPQADSAIAATVQTDATTIRATVMVVLSVSL